MTTTEELAAELDQLGQHADALHQSWVSEVKHFYSARVQLIASWKDELEVERKLADDLMAHRDAMVATVSFLASVIRSGEPFTPEVRAAVENFYTRWETMAAAWRTTRGTQK